MAHSFWSLAMSAATKSRNRQGHNAIFKWQRFQGYKVIDFDCALTIHRFTNENWPQFFFLCSLQPQTLFEFFGSFDRGKAQIANVATFRKYLRHLSEFHRSKEKHVTLFWLQSISSKWFHFRLTHQPHLSFGRVLKKTPIYFALQFKTPSLFALN